MGDNEGVVDVNGDGMRICVAGVAIIGGGDGDEAGGVTDVGIGMIGVVMVVFVDVSMHDGVVNCAGYGCGVDSGVVGVGGAGVTGVGSV